MDVRVQRDHAAARLPDQVKTPASGGQPHKIARKKRLPASGRAPRLRPEDSRGHRGCRVFLFTHETKSGARMWHRPVDWGCLPVKSSGCFGAGDSRGCSPCLCRHANLARWRLDDGPRCPAHLHGRIRQRQLGFDDDHDDAHELGEMVKAAICYAEISVVRTGIFPGVKGIIDRYPWAGWSPSADPIRNLEKAGALIAAEISRLQRLRDNGEPEPLTLNPQTSPT